VSSPFWRLYYNFDRSARINSSAGELRLGPENIVLIPADTVFSTHNDGPMTQLYFHFSAAEPFNTVKKELIVIPVTSFIRETAEILAETARTLTAQSVRFGLLGQALIAAALDMIPREKFLAPERDRRIADTALYIEKHLESSISNRDLAKRAGMSVNAFIRLFRQETGDSPQNYLCKKRVQKACVLLKYSPHSIDEIAQETGFCDRYYFSRVFKKICGGSPAGFRKA
jgi:transcriptional regulator GlxA family with amidase domain